MNTIITAIERFTPEILRSGTDEEKQQQLMNWSHGESNSIYVRWVPDEMLPNYAGNDTVPRNFFGMFGEIARMDFVPKLNALGMRYGHMAFIHYHYFFESTAELQQIVQVHPVPVDFTWYNCMNKPYEISCCVNTRPVAKVEFNPSQLTDMIQNLNMRLTTELKEKDAIIFKLQMDIQRIDAVVNELQARM